MPPRDKALFRILTEDVPGYSDAVIEALHRYGFPYSTTFSGVGYGPDQDDKPENSLAIDVVDDYSPETEKRMMDAVNDIRQENGPKGQGSVLLLCIPTAAALVTRNGAIHGGRILTATGDWEKLRGRLKDDALVVLFGEESIRETIAFSQSPEAEQIRQWLKKQPPSSGNVRCSVCGYETQPHEDLSESLKEFKAHDCKRATSAIL
ncbi:MAG: hypothetical protein WB711_16585 [Terriglobales bacterium]